MKAEILSTGDEVLLGDITDTNSSWLCRQLAQLGIRTGQITAVGDETDRICRTLKAIAHRADLCIVTGGLGPTSDDVTAQAVACAAGSELEMHSGALASMEGFFKKRGWHLTDQNKKQAMLPVDAEVLENCHGTAPGFELQIENCLFYCLPGVPGEMKEMYRRKVQPKLISRTGKHAPLEIRRLTVFGLPESEVGRRLAGFSSAFPQLRLGFRAIFPLIEVKLVCPDSAGNRGESEGDEMMAQGLEDAVAWAAERLDRRVVSFGGLTLEQEVGELLSAAGQTLSVAESCTGGLISHKITDVAGASDYFYFTGVTYANSAKTGVLGVSQETLEAHGAVHEKTAEEMAAGAKAKGGTDWGLSTTGIAGPSGGSAEKPVGTVCIGVAGPDKTMARRFVLDTGDRGKNKQLFAAAALEMLRRELAVAKAV